MDRVRSEVTPRVTRAGAASGLIQKETHCGGLDRVIERWILFKGDWIVGRDWWGFERSLGFFLRGFVLLSFYLVGLD